MRPGRLATLRLRIRARELHCASATTRPGSSRLANAGGPTTTLAASPALILQRAHLGTHVDVREPFPHRNPNPIPQFLIA